MIFPCNVTATNFPKNKLVWSIVPSLKRTADFGPPRVGLRWTGSDRAWRIEPFNMSCGCEFEKSKNRAALGRESLSWKERQVSTALKSKCMLPWSHNARRSLFVITWNNWIVVDKTFSSRINSEVWVLLGGQKVCGFKPNARLGNCPSQSVVADRTRTEILTSLVTIVECAYTNPLFGSYSVGSWKIFLR